jgi:16S rRNA (cytidine1402-2'-O)-methyltransferase
MKSGRFCFEGFLSVNKQSRRIHLSEVKDEKRTLIFYEAPHKLPATLKDMYEAFGDRKIALIRELTKIHEEVIHTTLSKASTMYTDTQPKGEFVLIIEGQKEEEKAVYTVEQAVKIAKEYMADGNSASTAARLAAEDTGIKKGNIYKLINKGM